MQKKIGADAYLHTYLLWNSWIQLSLQNESVLNESLSMNVFRMWGMAFIPDKLEPDIDRDSDEGELSRCNF
jgi:hypothetical protein